MNHRNFSQTTLSAAITDTTGTSIAVSSSATFPAAPFIASIDTEAMLVITVAGTTWTVTRGYEGSTAAIHLNRAIIYHDISAAEVDSFAVAAALAAAAAPLASPALTGTPTAPTAAIDTNTPQLATTAMVLAQAASATPLIDATTAVVGTSKRYARGDHVHPTDTGRAAITHIHDIGDVTNLTTELSAGVAQDAMLQSQVDAVRPFPAPVTTQIVAVPLTIDRTGATEVSAALNAFIATVPDGSIVAFPTDAIYKIHASLLVGDHNNLILEGNGTTLQIDATAEGDDFFTSQLIIGYNTGSDHPCTDIVAHGFILVGNSPTPGVYIAGQEYQANLVVEISDRVEVYDVTGSAAYGDFLYIKDANGVWVRDCHSPTLGRNGVSIISGADILIEGNAFDVSGHATFDFEPNEITDTISNVITRKNTAESFGYAFLALGSLAGGPIDMVVFDGNIVTGSSLLSFVGNTVSTDRITRFTFINNTGMVADAVYDYCLVINYVDGLIVNNNSQPIITWHKLIQTGDCTRIIGDVPPDAQVAALGITATVAELNIVDGVTATAAELNALDGITSTVTELNYTDGVTSAIQTQFTAKAPLAPTGATYTPATGAQTVALDVSVNNMHVVTGHASGTAITFTITGATNNQPFVVSILQGGTTVSTIAAWFATVRWAGGTAPTLTATLNKRDTFGFIRTGSDTYDGFVIGQNA